MKQANIMLDKSYHCGGKLASHSQQLPFHGLAINSLWSHILICISLSGAELGFFFLLGRGHNNFEQTITQKSSLLVKMSWQAQKGGGGGTTIYK